MVDSLLILSGTFTNGLSCDIASIGSLLYNDVIVSVPVPEICTRCIDSLNHLPNSVMSGLSSISATLTSNSLPDNMITGITGTLSSLISLKLQTSAIFAHDVGMITSVDFCYNNFINYSINTLKLFSTSCPTDAVNTVSGFSFKHNIASNYNNENFWSYIMYLAVMWFKKSIYLFMALIGYLVNYLVKTKSFSILTLFKLLYFMTLIKGVGASSIKETGRYLISFIGWFIYVLSMGAYDIVYKNIKKKHVEQRVTLISNSKLNYVFLNQRFWLGMSFNWVISWGVLFSTYLSYKIKSTAQYLVAKIMLMLGSNIIALIFSSIWLALTYPNILGFSSTPIMISLLRAFSESLTFNFLSLSNFIIWDWINEHTSNFIVPFIVPLFLYFPISYIQILFENRLDFMSVLCYGLVYVGSFTCLSTSSTALYNLMDVGHMSLLARLLLLLLSQVLVVALPLEVYRFTPTVMLGESIDLTVLESLLGAELANTPLIRYTVGAVYQLTVFYSFAFGTFIWIDMLNLVLPLL